MTNDPMLEKLIAENRTWYPDGLAPGAPCVWAISEDKLRTFMAGKRIVEDVPDTVVVPRRMPGGVWDAMMKLADHTPCLQGLFGHTLMQVIYSTMVEAAAPSDTEVGK